MAIRFSFADNFIGRISSNRRLIWNQKVNKQPPLPRKRAAALCSEHQIWSAKLRFLLGSIGFMFTSDKVNFHVLRSTLQVSMRLFDLTLILVFLVMQAVYFRPVEVDGGKRIGQDEWRTDWIVTTVWNISKSEFDKSVRSKEMLSEYNIINPLTGKSEKLIN